MAWTYTTLKAAIQTYLQNTETTFVSTIDTIIKQAEDRISKSVTLPMNRKTTTLSFTNGVATAALPADFLSPFELRSVVGNTFTPVDYVDVSFILEAYPDPTVTGIPAYYSMYDSATVILAPTPSASPQGYLHYFFKPASIVDASTSWLGTNAENCLLYACLAEAYTFLKGEAELDLIKLYEDKFQLALKDLRTLGEGMDLGDAYRMNERRVPR